MAISRTTHTREELADFLRPASVDGCMPPSCPEPEVVYQEDDDGCCIRRWTFPKDVFPEWDDCRHALADSGDVSVEGYYEGPGRAFGDAVSYHETKTTFVADQRTGLDI